MIFVVLGNLVWFQVQYSWAAERQAGEEVFSIRADNETLRKVFKRIAEVSGYEIRFNTQFADERVSIQLENVTLSEAIARVIRAYNKMVLWDDTNHIITLLVFKKNRPPVSISGANRIFELATETTTGP